MEGMAITAFTDDLQEVSPLSITVLEPWWYSTKSQSYPTGNRERWLGTAVE